MWNSLLDNARTLAAQAKAAAEKLEDTINVSVGAPPTASTGTTSLVGLGTFELDTTVDLWEDSNTNIFDSEEAVVEDDTNQTSTYEQPNLLPPLDEQDPPLDSTETIMDTISWIDDTISTSTPLDPTDTGLDNAGNNLSTAGEMDPDHVHEVQMDPPQSDECHDSVPQENSRISTPPLFATHDAQSFESSESSLYMQNHPSEPTMESLLIQQLQTQIQQLQQHVAARESQLTSKSQQITTMLELHNKEKDLLLSQVRDTKEEAKKRILVAKERVAEMQQHVLRLEAEVAATSSSSQDSSSQKEDLIQALRSEGQALAIKMNDVEQKAKDTRIQLLDVQDELTTQLALKEKMERKVNDLETELKSIRVKWTMAQQGEVRAEQLETSLLEIREEGEIKSAKIASLETEVKEYKSQMTSIKKDMDDLVRMKETENQSDIAKWKKEKSEWMEELNAKVQTLEQEATVREDALRKEVGELRKRWQDAVQRADALSMDMQQSSAPLMRQIESAERQNRARASAWAELETRLRNENEELNTTKDQLIKEKNELGSTIKRLERHVKDKEDELYTVKQEVEQVKNLNVELESKLNPVKKQLASIHKEHAEAMKSLKDHEGKIRSDMTRLLRESEVKYQNELDMERQTRSQLERKIEELLSLSSQTSMDTGTPQDTFHAAETQRSSRKKLTVKDDQVSILQSAIVGLSVEEEDDDENMQWVDESEDLNTDIVSKNSVVNSASYAHTEQLLQGIKAAKLELETLRSQFNDAETTKEKLLIELSRCKDAGERLPSLEKNFKIMEAELKEKNLEIRGLREDIAEVRLLYRAQLDALLEEKTRSTSAAEPRQKYSQGPEVSSDDVVVHYIN